MLCVACTITARFRHFLSAALQKNLRAPDLPSRRTGTERLAGAGPLPRQRKGSDLSGVAWEKMEYFGCKTPWNRAFQGHINQPKRHDEIAGDKVTVTSINNRQNAQEQLDEYPSGICRLFNEWCCDPRGTKDAMDRSAE